MQVRRNSDASAGPSAWLTGDVYGDTATAAATDGGN
jgi:hypothetical protein